MLKVLDGDDDGTMDFQEFCAFLMTLPAFNNGKDHEHIVEVVENYPDWVNWPRYSAVQSALGEVSLHLSLFCVSLNYVL